MSTHRPVVVVATPLTDPAWQVLQDVGDVVDLRHRPDLLPPMRHPGDHHGDPGHQRSEAEQTEFDQLVAGAEILYGIPGESAEQLARVVASAPNLRWVHTMAAGGGAQVVAADLPAEAAARITFTTSAGVHGVPLAEFALLALLMGAKDVPRLQAQQAAHSWPLRVPARPLAGRTVLVLGLGGIGREVAVRCRALGMRVIGVNRSGDTHGVTDLTIDPADLLETARQADDVVVTLPGTRWTTALVGAELLASLRPGGTVVNVGRGTVVDEDALLAALRTGQVGFAAFDAFTTEPLPRDSAWWDEQRMLVSPHSAALDRDEDLRIARQFVQNLQAYLTGTAMINVVDVEAGY